jgi:Lipocalin-like domain
MTRVITTAALVSMLAAFPVMAADNDLVGTYKLVIEQRTIVDAGEVIPVKNPQGYITYGGDGRMMVIIVRHPRPRPESIEKTTDQERADLLRTLTAYAGTYKFNGTEVSARVCNWHIWDIPPMSALRPLSHGVASNYRRSSPSIRCLVALPPCWDLLLSAKHLFSEAKGRGAEPGHDAQRRAVRAVRRIQRSVT